MQTERNAATARPTGNAERLILNGHQAATLVHYLSDAFELVRSELPSEFPDLDEIAGIPQDAAAGFAAVRDLAVQLSAPATSTMRLVYGDSDRLCMTVAAMLVAHEDEHPDSQDPHWRIHHAARGAHLDEILDQLTEA